MDGITHVVDRTQAALEAGKWREAKALLRDLRIAVAEAEATCTTLHDDVQAALDRAFTAMVTCPVDDVAWETWRRLHGDLSRALLVAGERAEVVSSWVAQHGGGSGAPPADAA